MNASAVRDGFRPRLELLVHPSEVKKASFMQSFALLRFRVLCMVSRSKNWYNGGVGIRN